MSVRLPPISLPPVSLPTVSLPTVSQLWSGPSLLRRTQAHVGAVRAMAAPAEGGRFASGGDDGAALVWSEQGVRLVLGILSVVFAAYMLLKPVAKKPISTYWALPASSVCGFTSFIAHAGAPPMNMYLMPRKLTKETFIATCTVTYAVVNTIKLGPYMWLGEVNMTSAWASLLLVPVAWIGVRNGLWLQSRVNEKLFYRLVILAMFLVGLNLVWQAVR